MSNVIVTLSKKLAICANQTPSFTGFQCLDLKHSESATRLNGQILN